VSTPSTHIIQQKLHQFLRKYFLIELYKGLALFIFFSLIYLFIAGTIEYFFWLPPNIKKALIFTSILVILVFFIAFLYNPLANLTGLKQSLKSEKAAGLIGKHFPEIQDKLLNLLQLQKNNQDSELLQASIDQKARELVPFDFTNALDFKQQKKYFSLLLIPFVFLLLIKITGKEKAFEGSYKRLLSYNTYFQPPAPFKVSLLSPKQFTFGKDYNLSVKVVGNTLPQQLHFSLASQAPIKLHRENDSIFSLNISQPKDDLRFYLLSGKYRFGPYQINIHHPSVITQTKMKLIYPSYLHKNAEVLNGPRNLSLPQDTQIQWDISAAYTDTISFIIDDKTQAYTLNYGTLKIIHKAAKTFFYGFFPGKDAQNKTLNYKIEIIEDQLPKLIIEEKIDSLNFVNHYRIQASDDHKIKRLQIYYKTIDEPVFHKQDIAVKHTDYIQSFFKFPTDIKVDSLHHSYVFYFKVSDNFPYSNHAVKSKKFYYNYMAPGQKQKYLLEKQNETLKQLSERNQEILHQNKQFNVLQKKLNSRTTLDWQTKQSLDRTIQNQEQQEQFFRQSLKKFKNIIEKLPTKDNIFNKEELKKRLQEMEQMQKKKKMLDELKKLAEKLDKEGLLKKIKELKNYSKHQEKSLERMLELTKKYYIRQKLNALSKRLDTLSKQQKELSKKDSDTPQEQQKINKEFSKISKDLDSLSKTNKTLKKPMSLDYHKTDSKEIKQDLQKAVEQLSQNNAPSSNSTQQKASKKMKQMSQNMQMALSGGGSQHSEDIATLQALLKSLLNFSFTQESLLNQFKTGSVRQQLANHLLEQNKQKTYFKAINDSLYTLALRNPKISQKLLDLAYNIETELDLTLNNLSDLKAFSGQAHAQFVLTYSNTLADMISQALDNEKNSSSSQGSGQGKKKGKGISLPDIIKKQGNSIKEMEQALSKKNSQIGKKSGKTKGKTGDLNSQQQYEMYKKQQQIKDALLQLQDKFTNKSDVQKINYLLNQMDDLNRRLLKEGITNRTLEILKHIQQELLKLKNASFNQEHDNKRLSRTNTNNYTSPDSLFFQKSSKFAPSLELLNRNQIPVNQKVKQKIIQYINHD